MFSANLSRRIPTSLRASVPVLVVALVLMLGNAPRVSAKPEPRVCENVHLSGKLPRPSKKGFEIRQVVTLNDDCTVKEGPVEEVPVTEPSNSPAIITEQLPSVTAASSNSPITLSSMSSKITPLATFTNQTRSKSEMYDPVGILLTALYSNDAWSGDWTRITSYNVQSSASWHVENGTGGWSLANRWSNGGCALPCGSATFNQHAEFSYKGFFDQGGTLYYNIHDNQQTLNGNSSYSCTFSVNIRKWYPGWTWAKGCA